MVSLANIIHHLRGENALAVHKLHQSIEKEGTISCCFYNDSITQIPKYDKRQSKIYKNSAPDEYKI